jgi:hypothetical protein
MPPDLRESMGARGRAWVTDHFNSRTVGEQVLAVYADLLETPARDCAAA